jgi:putative flavoprotein involved in K+ transport
MEHVDVIVIGAGQAGLSAGYYLKAAQKSFVILEAHDRIGKSWSQRYDSLVLFSPRRYSSLPGLKFPGEPFSYPTKDETAQYLETYAKAFELPIQLSTNVTSVHKQEGKFIVETNSQTFSSDAVIVAAGPFHTPFIPEAASQLTAGQLHSSDYLNPSQIVESSVLVVGAGNSGSQIAAELSRTYQVSLSASHRLKFFPMNIGRKPIFWYFDKLGFFTKQISTRLGKWINNQPEIIYGTELKQGIKEGRITIKPRVVQAQDRKVTYADGTEETIDFVVWATGFKPHYPWLQIENVLDQQGRPLHSRGVSPVHGLYYVGLPKQTCRGSALLGWVGRDAEEIVRQIGSL